MSYFSPRCPKCQKSDELEIYYDGKSYHYYKYYCRRCKEVFESSECYPEVTASFYQVTEGSISGASYFRPSSC